MAEPTVSALLVGDVERSAEHAAKYGLLLAELGQRVALEEVIDLTVRGPRAALVAAAALRPGAHWRERTWVHPLGFRLRTAAAQAARGDAGLQVGILLDGPAAMAPRPVVIYTDWTVPLSARRPEGGRVPLGRRGIRRLIALEAAACRSATLVCTRSELARRSVVDDLGVAPDRVRVVGGGVNLPALPDLPGPDAAPLVLFVGRDFHRKGGDRALRAFAHARERVPEARMAMVTAGPVPVDLPTAGVEIRPPVDDRHELAALYAAATAFVLPSRLETWGDVLLEAMAFALPCVVTAGDAMEEIVLDGRTGSVVAPDDDEALGARLAELLADPSLAREQGGAGRVRVVEQFTWAHVADRLADALATSSS